MSKFQLNVVHKGTKKLLKLSATDTVAQLLEQAVSALGLTKPLAEYVIYNPNTAARQRWLANELIASEHLKEQQDVEVITRWMIVRVELWAPSTSNVPSKILSTKYLALDAFVPLLKFLQIAAKKIQLEDMDAFGIYNNNIGMFSRCLICFIFSETYFKLTLFFFFLTSHCNSYEATLSLLMIYK